MVVPPVKSTPKFAPLVKAMMAPITIAITVKLKKYFLLRTNSNFWNGMEFSFAGIIFFLDSPINRFG